MKTSQILNILLAVALVILSIKIVIDSKDKADKVVPEEGAIETIIILPDFQTVTKMVA